MTKAVSCFDARPKHFLAVRLARAGFQLLHTEVEQAVASQNLQTNKYAMSI